MNSLAFGVGIGLIVPILAFRVKNRFLVSGISSAVTCYLIHNY